MKRRILHFGFASLTLVTFLPPPPLALLCCCGVAPLLLTLPPLSHYLSICVPESEFSGADFSCLTLIRTYFRLGGFPHRNAPNFSHQIHLNSVFDRFLVHFLVNDHIFSVVAIQLLTARFWEWKRQTNISRAFTDLFPSSLYCFPILFSHNRRSHSNNDNVWGILFLWNDSDYSSTI